MGNLTIKIDELPDDVKYLIFQALSHPYRVKILTLIEGNDLTFGSLKHKVGMESSGQLQHHLQKLSGLISEKANGSYGLTDSGRRALDIFRESERSGRSLEDLCRIPSPQEMAHDKQIVSRSSQEPRSRKDLWGHANSFAFLFWGVPMIIALLGSLGLGMGWLVSTQSDILWITATSWIAGGCLVNARRSSRVHCIIVGYLFPLLALSGIMNLIGIFSFSWNVYWAVFLAILIASFLTEYLWRPYYRLSQI